MTEKKTTQKGIASATPASPANTSLEAKKSTMHRDGFFTSDLSVDEFLLLDEGGFEPVGLVIGSSIYHIGYQPRNWLQNQEMEVLSQVMYDARGWAMKRMMKEAKALKADGIVGVRIEVTPHERREALAEFVAIGTAVRACNPDIFRSTGGKFFTSDLSGQDFWTLRRAGY
ncbi:MAG TPA: heavy metal-binding domain-containing protein, partial [Ktedonobacteraceae bacterium]|nr:heavy metal-binding domain-containing protein [Ktedonobacteraceae bacterium]